MGIMDLFKKKSSGNVAKDRLKLVLVSDRANCSSEMMEMMKEMFPEGFGSAGENSMDFFSGMAGMPDMSSVFEMFGKEV